VSSVAVAPGEQGQGLGSLVVQGVEAMARRRGIGELFAMTSSDGFFESLGYEPTTLDRYPEKIARYEALVRKGVAVVPRSCFHKMTGWR
jgi:amino-acid N-acetyltransferase